MQIDAFQRGDRDALAEAVEASIPEVWRLARAGFVTTDDGLEAEVHGIESPDVIERLVAQALARCYTPERRKQIESEEALREHERAEARAVLIEHAIRSGSLATLADESDRAIAAEAERDPAPSIGMMQHRETLSAIAVGVLAKMDERTQRLVELRFAEGKSAKETAAELGCGAAAIAAHERRVRHQVRHALRVAFPDEKPGDALIDALLAKQALAPLPPAITRERIKRAVLSRTFREEPPPFGARLAWALGALAIACALWAMMYFDVLPHPEDDLIPQPRVEVECKSTCKFRVLAPRDMKRVAIGLARKGHPGEAWLMSPSGGSIRLPIGARVKAVEIPYTAELPRSFDRSEAAWAVAVFSEERLNRDQITALTDGRTSIDGVFTTSTAIALEP